MCLAFIPLSNESFRMLLILLFDFKLIFTYIMAGKTFST